MFRKNVSEFVIYLISFITIIVMSFIVNANGANVITWVPPYSWQSCKTMLNTDFGGVKMEDGITHLALQFWGPVPADGSIKYVTHEWQTPSDATVAEFTSWASGKNVKVLLCLYNNDGSWNWNLVKPIIDDPTKRTNLVNSLVSKMQALGLDGVEIDLEYPAGSNADKTNFMAFMNELSTAVHGLGKDLTIATFAYIWNFPNSDCWNELAAITDGITSMGYEEIGRNASGWASYSTQKTLVNDPSKLMLGMPTYVGSWQGSTAESQVDWVVADGEVGVGIWDCSLADGAGTAMPGWRTASIWNKLKQIKGTASVTTKYTISSSAQTGGSISPFGNTSVDSGSSQSYTISTNAGYEVDYVNVDGSSIGAVTSYTFNNVSADHNIQAYFKAKPIPKYNITSSAGANGSISPQGVASIDSASSKTYTINANSGFAIDSVIVDGSYVGRVSTYTFSGVKADHSIRAVFKAGFTITASAENGGSISPSGNVFLLSGENQTFTITPDANFEIDYVIVDGSNKGAVASYTFSNVTSSHSIQAYFKGSYTITASGGNKGSISPEGSIVVPEGGNQTFTITPNNGWGVDYIRVDGIQIDPVFSYTFSDVTSDHAIFASFSKNGIKPGFTITATAGSNGSISPSGSVAIGSGQDQTFTFTPDNGYEINDVLVDGSSVGAVSSYTFNSVTANHSVEVSFKAVSVTTYTVTATAGSNGTITPAGATVVNEGGAVSYTISPLSGYEIEDVIVNGASQGAISSYEFTNITANQTITASFKAIQINQYSITATAGSNGAITPSGVTTLNEGSSVSYSITANTGYVIDFVTVDGVDQGSIGSYDFNSVTENHTISAYFAVVSTGGACDGVPEWTSTGWTTGDYVTGYKVTNNNHLWEVVNEGQTHWEPSSAEGYYGWGDLGECDTTSANDTTVEISSWTNSSKDTTLDSSEVVTAGFDTVVTVIFTENSYDTTFTKTDSITKGSIFSSKIDTAATSSSVPVDTTVDTLFQGATPDTTVDTVSQWDGTIKDSVVDVNSEVTAGLDTIVTSNITETMKTYLYLQIDSLSDNVVFATIYDTTLTDSTVNVYTVKDTFLLKTADTTTEVSGVWNGIIKDSVVDVAKEITSVLDTIVTTTITETVYENQYTKIDSLADGEIFGSKIDTFQIDSYENAYVEKDTLLYDPPVSVNPEDVNVAVKSPSVFKAVPAIIDLKTKEPVRFIVSGKICENMQKAELAIFNSIGDKIYEIEKSSWDVKRLGAYILIETLEAEELLIGAYLAVVKISYNDGSVKVYKLLSGVRR